MNERIRELAKQADGVFIHKLITGAKQYTFLEKDLEKFAELIVTECSQISRDHQRNYYESHGDRIAKKIKQHFGVEL